VCGSGFGRPPTSLAKRLPRSQHYNVHRRFPAKPTLRLRHPQVDSTDMRQNVWLPGPAHRSSPDLGAGLAARFDRDPGWSPWPTPDIQTRMIASSAPRATSPAQSPTSPGHGWPSHLLSQRLQSRTASTVLTRSKPASNRPSAGCTRPLRTTPGDLAGLLADMESVLVLVGVAGWHRDDPEDCYRLRYRRSHSCGRPGRAARALGIPARLPCRGDRDGPAWVRAGEETLPSGDPLASRSPSKPAP